jgi:hypothetical protein
MARRRSDDQSIALAIPIVCPGYSNERINLGWRQVLSGSPSLLVRRAAAALAVLSVGDIAQNGVWTRAHPNYVVHEKPRV